MTESVTLTEAARRLRVSRTKVWAMVRAGELESYPDPLDKRQRLVPVRLLEDLETRRHGAPQPTGFVSDGAADNPSAVPSDEIEAYLRDHWRC